MSVSVCDGKRIGTCDVHSTLCRLQLCPNERTLIAGCEDGTVASYVIIDPEVDDPESVIMHTNVRELTNVFLLINIKNI
jgi:hypothetical protein